MCAITKEPIQQTPINAKEKNQSSHTMLKIVFSHIIPVLVRQKKTGKKIKKTTSGVYVPVFNSPVIKMDPKIFKKENHVAHSIPDGSA